MVDACPSAELLQALLEDEAGERAFELEEHVSGCERCQKRLDVMTHYPALVTAGTRDSVWTDSHSGAVIKHVAAALAIDSKHGANSLHARHQENSEHRTPEIPGYEILNRIGSGGSSDVYRAYHRQLSRIVALKISRERALPEQRDRFRREAEALARLHHPGVVQIYETGQVNGSIFMSLEYEASGSLSQFLKGTPQPAVEAARFVAAAATAVHAAHQQGLIHRDLKPGNLLLHPLTESGSDKSLAAFTPKVTDFGLVKLVSEESGLTASRDVLGTPSYMSPEQVTANSPLIGPATDVYALGAVLYEMLTGRPPFRAATAIDTVVQVRHDEPVPPSRLIRSVPVDLETVCLKCLEKEPARRYATAAELADDLTRFVEGRPVKARPIRWPIRVWRWTRRNPRIAILSAAVLTLLAGLAVFGPVIAYQQSMLRKKAEDAEAKALKQWDRADQNMLAANDAIWSTTTVKVADLDFSGDPDAHAQQLALIEYAMPLLQKARLQDPDLPSHRQRLGMAFYLHGRITRRSGDLARAEADLQEASNIVERLAADRTDKVEYAILAVLIQLEQAQLAVARKQPDAEAHIRAVVQRFGELTKQDTQQLDAWYGLAESNRLLAEYLESKHAEPEPVAEALRRSLGALHQLAAMPADRDRSQISEIQIRLHLASHLLNHKQNAAAEQEYREAVRTARRQPKNSVPSLTLLFLRSLSAQLLADCLVISGKAEEARGFIASATQSVQALVDLYPEHTPYKLHDVECLLTRVKVELALKQFAAAREALTAAEVFAKTLKLPPATQSRLASLQAEVRAAQP